MTWTKDELDKRYQNQPWYTKLWRRRWYLMIPIWALRDWENQWMGWSEETQDWDIPGERVKFSLAWRLALGHAQGKMEWWFTMEECNLNMREKFGKGHEDSI